MFHVFNRWSPIHKGSVMKKLIWSRKFGSAGLIQMSWLSYFQEKVRTEPIKYIHICPISGSKAAHFWVPGAEDKQQGQVITFRELHRTSFRSCRAWCDTVFSGVPIPVPHHSPGWVAGVPWADYTCCKVCNPEVGDSAMMTTLPTVSCKGGGISGQMDTRAGTQAGRADWWWCSTHHVRLVSISWWVRCQLQLWVINSLP